jgi:hypothetical protein
MHARSYNQRTRFVKPRLHLVPWDLSDPAIKITRASACCAFAFVAYIYFYFNFKMAIAQIDTPASALVLAYKNRYNSVMRIF